MIQIRDGVFETNSSSIHVIVIKDSGKELNTAQNVFFGLDTFGWSFRVLDTIDERAAYFYTACYLIERDNAEDKIRKLLPKDTQAKFATPIYEPDPYGCWLVNGDIDHCNELVPWVNELLHDKEKFLHFLFDDGSFVVTSNDNGPADKLDDVLREYHEGDGWDNPPGTMSVFVKGN